MTALDAANAAPPASDKERKSALGWIALIAVLGVIALVIAGVYSYKSHKAEVAKIEAAPEAGIPASENPTITRKKVATKKIAPQAVNTPSISKNQEQIDFESDVKLFNQLNKDKVVIVPKKAKKPLSPEDAAFEKELDDLEAQFKKDEL